jgi:hypothetical protein
MGAVGNRYHDGGDLALSTAAGANFRLDTRRLEPGCLPALSLPHVDIGDGTTSVHIRFQFANQDFSIDQVLVPGQRTGYRVVTTFDTGTVSNDPDIDPGQEAVNIDGPMYRDPITRTLKQDNVAIAAMIVCISDHEDVGQNEPYAHSDGGAGAGDGVSDANEVYAKNRPIIRPTVASLGQGAVRGVKGYKLGLGYSVERWYSTATIADDPPFTLRLTDPMGFSLDKVETFAVLGGTSTRTVIDTAAGHVSIPPRIAGPRFDAVTDGPGVLRVNDIDVAGENFDDPHFEFSNYDQTDVFNVRGDAQSFCLGGFSCAGIVAFGAQGDLPITWSLKASLAAVDTLRSVSLTPAMFDAWEQGWQDYYCGKGAHPTLPLTPGTNSPDPRGACPAVNPPETRPTAAPQVVVNAAPITIVTPAAPATAKPAAPAAKPVVRKATAKQEKAFKRCMAKANKKSGKAKRTARARCARMPHRS